MKNITKKKYEFLEKRAKKYTHVNVMLEGIRLSGNLQKFREYVIKDTNLKDVSYSTMSTWLNRTKKIHSIFTVELQKAVEILSNHYQYFKKN